MPGANDANGVYNYAEDDNISLFSDLLNLGTESISTQFTADRTRLSSVESRATALEARAVPGSTGFPYRTAAGNAVAGTTATVVTFPSGRFTSIPIVTIAAGHVSATGATGYHVAIVYASTSTTSFSAISLTAATAITYIATQMTSTSGAG